MGRMSNARRVLFTWSVSETGVSRIARNPLFFFYAVRFLRLIGWTINPLL